VIHLIFAFLTYTQLHPFPPPQKPEFLFTKFFIQIDPISINLFIVLSFFSLSLSSFILYRTQPFPIYYYCLLVYIYIKQYL